MSNLVISNKSNFKQRQWRLPQEAEIKQLIANVRALIKRNEDASKRRHPNSNLYLDFYDVEDEDVTVISKESQDTTRSNANNSSISKNPKTGCQGMIKKNKL